MNVLNQFLKKMVSLFLITVSMTVLIVPALGWLGEYFIVIQVRRIKVRFIVTILSRVHFIGEAGNGNICRHTVDLSLVVFDGIEFFTHSKCKV